MTHDLSIEFAVWSEIFLRLAVMTLVCGIVIYFAYLSGKKINRKRPRGVIIFGVLLILGSVYKLWGFLDYDYYRFMFQQLSDEAIRLRYLFSILSRVAALIIAAGILLMKDAFRKLLLLVCLLTLCFIYWKHPFSVFENISRYTEQRFLNKVVVDHLTYPWHPWISLIFNYLVDIVFCGSAVYYFTRPNIKKQFNS